MTSGRSLAILADNAHNDLEAITDIGPKFARALYQIGVHHFSDLAEYSPDELSQSLLEGAELRVSSERIATKNWIGQAKALAEAAKPEVGSSPENAEVGQDAEWPLDDSSWRQKAAFTLWFGHVTDEQGKQVWHTCIYHESGEQEVIELEEPIARENFEGVVIEPWVDWILERAELPNSFRPLPKESGVDVPPAADTGQDLGLEMLDADTFAVGSAADLCKKRLGARVHFRLSGSAAKSLTAGGTAFWVQAYAEDSESGMVSLVASERGRLVPQKLDYLEELQFPIPELGRYRLQILVLLPPPVSKMVLHEGPTFSVVP